MCFLNANNAIKSTWKNKMKTKAKKALKLNQILSINNQTASTLENNSTKSSSNESNQVKTSDYSTKHISTILNELSASQMSEPFKNQSKKIKNLLITEKIKENLANKMMTYQHSDDDEILTNENIASMLKNAEAFIRNSLVNSSLDESAHVSNTNEIDFKKFTNKPVGSSQITSSEEDESNKSISEMLKSAEKFLQNSLNSKEEIDFEFDKVEQHQEEDRVTTINEMLQKAEKFIRNSLNCKSIRRRKKKNKSSRRISSKLKNFALPIVNYSIVRQYVPQSSIIKT